MADVVVLSAADVLAVLPTFEEQLRLVADCCHAMAAGRVEAPVGKASR